MTDAQFTHDILSTIMTAVMIATPFILICKGRAIMSWLCDLYNKFFGPREEFDEYGEYIDRG